MRIQLHYSILGLDPTKVFDIVIDEKGVSFSTPKY
jgi:hypothetical protein